MAQSLPNTLIVFFTLPELFTVTHCPHLVVYCPAWIVETLFSLTFSNELELIFVSYLPGVRELVCLRDEIETFGDKFSGLQICVKRVNI